MNEIITVYHKNLITPVLGMVKGVKYGESTGLVIFIPCAPNTVIKLIDILKEDLKEDLI